MRGPQSRQHQFRRIVPHCPRQSKAIDGAPAPRRPVNASGHDNPGTTATVGSARLRPGRRSAAEANGIGFAGFAAAETEELDFANEYLKNSQAKF
jgi:hypothetical protein